MQKGTVLLLYWFAAWQQFNTSRRQKHGSYYLKFNAQFSEPNLSIEKQEGVPQTCNNQKVKNVYLRYLLAKDQYSIKIIETNMIKLKNISFL